MEGRLRPRTSKSSIHINSAPGTEIKALESNEIFLWDWMACMIAEKGSLSCKERWGKGTFSSHIITVNIYWAFMKCLLKWTMQRNKENQQNENRWSVTTRGVGWVRKWERDSRGRGYIYIYIHLWLIYVDVWQKPTQHCKAIILQLKF